jgi:hypothetical protein
MSTKLVKLRIPQPLHTRIKTVAASKNKALPIYILSVLEEHVPREVRFPDDPKAKKSPGKVTGL